MKHSTECISVYICYLFIYIYMKKKKIIINFFFLDIKNIAVYLPDILRRQTKRT